MSSRGFTSVEISPEAPEGGAASLAAAKGADRPFLRTMRQFKDYAIVEIASRSLALISIPTFTRLMAPADYGVFTTAVSLATLSMYVLTLNLHRSVGRYVYEPAAQDKPLFVGTVLCASLISSLVQGCLLYVFRGSLLPFLGMPPSLWWYFLGTAIVTIPIEIFGHISQSEERSGRIAIAGLIRGYGGFGLSVVLAIATPLPKYVALCLGALAWSFVVSVLLLFVLRRKIKLALPRRTHLAYAVQYSVPLIPYYLGSAGLGQLNKIMVLSMAGGAAAGVFGVAQNLGSLTALLVGALNSAWLPRFFQYVNARRFQEHDRDTARLTRLAALGAILLGLYGPNIGRILAPIAYHEGLWIIPVISFSYVIYAIYNVYARMLGYARITILSSAVALLGAIANFGMNILLISCFGYAYSAFATLASYLVLLAGARFAAGVLLRQHTTPLRVFLVPTLVALVASAGSVALCARPMHLAVDIAVRSACAFPCVIALVWPERKNILGFVKSVFGRQSS